VSVDEALRVLGYPDVSDPKALRRAYLGKIKVHKPEADPQGFQLVREAYEFLRDMGSFEVQLLARTSGMPGTAPFDPAGEAESAEANEADSWLEAGALDDGGLQAALQGGDWQHALDLWTRTGALVDDVMSDDRAWALTFSLEAAGLPDRAEVAFALWRARAGRDVDAHRSDVVLARISEEYFDRRPYLTADARIMIAQALVDRDWSEAPARLSGYRGLAGGPARASMRAVIGASTPNLLSVLGLTAPKPWAPSPRPLAWIAFLFFVALKIGLVVARHHEGPNRSAERVKAAKHMDLAAGPLSAALPRDADMPLGFPMGRLRLAAVKRDCSSIAAILEEVDQRLVAGSQHGERLTERLAPFRRVLARECPP
jgi:hypothetical protein